MANNDFFAIFHDIDDKFIAEAQDIPQQPSYAVDVSRQGGLFALKRVALAAAACLAVFAAGSAALALFNDRTNDMVSPDSFIGAASANPNSAAVSEWLKKPLAYPLEIVPQDFSFNSAVLIEGKKSENLLPANAGDAVYAVDDGVVTRCAVCGLQMPGGEYTVDWGYVVTIKHENDIYTNYFHLQDAPLVKFGDNVAAGQLIGSVSGDSFSGVSGLGYCISGGQ